MLHTSWNSCCGGRSIPEAPWGWAAEALVQNPLSRTPCTETHIENPLSRTPCAKPLEQSPWYRTPCTEPPVQNPWYRTPGTEPPVQNLMPTFAHKHLTLKGRRARHHTFHCSHPVPQGTHHPKSWTKVDLLTRGSDRKWSQKAQILTRPRSCSRKPEVPSKLLITSHVHVEERLFIAPHYRDDCISKESWAWKPFCSH